MTVPPIQPASIDAEPSPRDVRRRVWIILTRTVVSLGLSLALVWLAVGWFDADFAEGRSLPIGAKEWLWFGVGTVLVAPVLENLVLVWLLHLGDRFVPRMVSDLLAAVTLGLMHGFFNVAWGVVAGLIFVVLVNAYRSEAAVAGWRSGFWVSVAVHALHNAVAFTLLAGLEP